jgi:hypothetical protein
MADPRVPGTHPRPFPVYDNMSYIAKPDTKRYGLIPSNIISEEDIWPHGQNYGVLPSRISFDAIVSANKANPGPIVLDIEKLPLIGSPDTIRQHLDVLATLADWTRADAPGKIVGYYGYNTLTAVPPANRSYAQELADHVDAFFPSMYTFDDNRAAWAARAQTEAAEDRALAASKPVLFYLWPQYHDGTPKQFQYIDASYWQVQLNTAYGDADGIVLWGPSRFAWDETSGWWAATVEFMQQIASANPLGSAS